MIDYYTIAPLTNLGLPVSSRYELGHGLVLAETPVWLIKESMLRSLSESDRHEVQLSTYALIATYKAAALGDPDRNWKGEKPKSIQDTKYEHCVLGNLALWLARPSPVHFSAVVHAPDYGSGPIAQRMTSHAPLLCHPNDIDQRIREDDIPLASQLFQSLVMVEQEGTLWTAVRATWAALQTNMEVVRYALFWVVLEALFGPDDAHETTYRISLRLARMLEADAGKARVLFAVAKNCYGFRSKIVHGRWKEDPESTIRVSETEELVRRSLVRVFSDPQLAKVFSEKARERFLDDLVI